MELSYEQHIELLNLANYLTRLKRAASHNGVELNSMVNHNHDINFVTYVNNPVNKDVRMQKESDVVLDKA